MKNIVFYGAPAAGKGTQCDILIKEYKYKQISIGQALRDLDDTTELGKKVHQLQKEGILVDDETVSSVLKQKIKEIGTPIIIDGFPRNINQAKILDTFLKDYIVINLNVSENVALKRTLGRRLCEKCNTGYNIFSDSFKPKEDGKCDICKGNLISRTDDNEESFKTRFNVYLNNVKDVLNYFKEKNILYIIESYENAYDTFTCIKEVLNDNNKE